MSDIIILVALAIISFFLSYISSQLARIIRLLYVIASKADYVPAQKAMGKE